MILIGRGLNLNFCNEVAKEWKIKIEKWKILDGFNWMWDEEFRNTIKLNLVKLLNSEKQKRIKKIPKFLLRSKITFKVYYVVAIVQTNFPKGN